MNHQEKKDYAIGWYFTPTRDRGQKTQRELAEYLEVHEQTIANWFKPLKEQAENYEGEAFMTFLKREAMKSNPSAGIVSLYAELTGLKDKREEVERFEPTAQDYAKWGKELLRRLREDWRECGGVCPLCGRPDSLLQEVCLDSEQEHGEDGEMGAVGLS